MLRPKSGIFSFPTQLGPIYRTNPAKPFAKRVQMLFLSLANMHPLNIQAVLQEQGAEKHYSKRPPGSAGIKFSTGGPASSPLYVFFGSIGMRSLFKCTGEAWLQQLHSYFVCSGKGDINRLQNGSLSGRCKQTTCYVIGPFGNWRKVSGRSGPSQCFLILLGLTSKPAL